MSEESNEAMQEEVSSEVDSGYTDQMFSLSDEDFLKTDPDTFYSVEEEDTDEEESGEEEEEDAVAEGDISDVEDEEDTDDSSEDVTEDEESTDLKEDTVDYKAQLDKLLSPFKANGHDIKVASVDEAITLMQMGANYAKKMQSIKPILRTAKMLKNNGLMDETKLSQLIDLSKRKPEAIANLVKESGINPMDIDTEKETDYIPTDYSVTDNEIELEDVIANVQATPSGNDSIKIMQGMDEVSRQLLADNPSVIPIINQQVSDGTYNKVMAEVEKRRLLGEFSGVPTISAYQQVGQYMQSNGMLGSDTPTPSTPENIQSDKPKEPAKKKTDKTRKQRMKALSPKRKATTKSTDPNFDPLTLGDEDFVKFMKQNV